MKKTLLNIASFLSLFWKLIPQAIRINFLTGLFILESRGSNTSKGMTRLFLVKDKLNWVINERALAYGKNVHPKHFLTNYHNFFVDNIINGEKVLDVGCGYGAVSKTIAEAKPDCKVIGIDYDKKKILQAEDNNEIKNLNFEICDANKNLPNGKWDVVVLSNVLEHINNRKFFLDFIIKKSCCKKILIRVPCFERSWEIPMRKHLGIYYYSDNDHKIEHTVNEFKEEMTASKIQIKNLNTVWGEIWAVCKVKQV